MNFIEILPAPDLEKSILGGKGYQLSKWMELRFPVPFAFVITSRAFDLFLNYNSSILRSISLLVDSKDSFDLSKLTDLCDRLSLSIKDAKIPSELEDSFFKAFDELNFTRIAVRSSASNEDGDNVSFAGQFSSILCVSRQNLLQSIKSCWASYFSLRAVSYQLQLGLEFKPTAFSVIVQSMIDAKISGVTFTTHPISKDKNQMCIEAISGLGEALVSGEVVPDRIIVNKITREISSYAIGNQYKKLICAKDTIAWQDVVSSNQKKINPIQLRSLIELCMDIEKIACCSCDIEWAIAENGLYLLQVRPVTA